MSRRIKQVGSLIVVVLAVVLAGFGQATAQVAQVRYTYIANAADGTVSAINLVTNRVEWTLKIGEKAAHGIAASPDGSIVYAGDSAAKEVVVIDAGRRVILKRIPLATAVHGMDLSPDGKTLWVGGSLGDDPVKGTLTVINAINLTIEDVISPGLGSASHFAFTPDGKEIWVASTSTNLVWIVDTATRQVTAAVPLWVPETRQRPAPEDDWTAYLAERKIIGLNEVAISPDGSRAYAVGPTTSQLFAIDVKSRRVLKSVPAGQRAHGVAVSPDGKEVWIADWAGLVSVFDADSLKQLASIRVAETSGVAQARGANHVAFSRDGQRAYASSIRDVAVIDARGRRVLGRVAVGQEPHEFSLEDWVAPGAWVDVAAVRAAAQGAVPTPTGTPSPTATRSTLAATPQAARNELTRINDEGAVTVEVTPLNLTGTGATLDFQVVLETHSVELDYDLTKIAVLRDDQGNEYTPTAWSGPRGGHHVSGTLQFDNRSGIVKPGLKYLELELRGIAQVPSRMFRWELSETPSGKLPAPGEGEETCPCHNS